MTFTLNERLIAEAKRYRLRSACPDCLFFVAEGAHCLHGWPNRNQRWDVSEAAAENSETVSFCKEFELA